jgi:hypothetical protein
MFVPTRHLSGQLKILIYQMVIGYKKAELLALLACM